MKLLKKKEKFASYLIEIAHSYFRLGIVEYDKKEAKFFLKNFRSFYPKENIEKPSFWDNFEGSFRNIYSPNIKKARILISPKNFTSCVKMMPLIPKKEARDYCNQLLVHEQGENLEEYYLDQRIEKMKKQDFIAAMVLGIEKPVLDKLVGIFNISDVAIERIDTSVTVTEAIFSRLKLVPEGSSVLALRIEEMFSELFVLKDDFVVHYAFLNVGLKNIRASLIRTVYTQVGPIEITKEDARKIIRDIGYTREQGIYLGINYEQLRILLLPALESLSQTMNIALEEYKKEFPALEFSNIYLLGKSEEMKGLGEFLEEKFSGTHIYLNPVSISGNMEVEEPLEKRISEVSFLVGLLYPQKKRYDFLPLHYKISRGSSRVREKSMFYIVSLGVVLSVFYLEIRATVFYLNKMSVIAEKVYSRMLPLVEKVKLLDKFTQEVTSFQTAVTKIYSRYPDWIGILKTLSAVTPDDIVIDKLESRTEEGINIIFLEGKINASTTSSNLILNKFIQALEATSYFKDVRLINTAPRGREDLSHVKFRLQGELK